MERQFTPRQKLCYTAIVKFAVTNSTWDFKKPRFKRATTIREVFDPRETTEGLPEDVLTLYYNRIVSFTKGNPRYDQNSPYVKSKWYVHVEDPNYKPRYPKKPWDPSDKVDWAPRRTNLGYDEVDPELEVIMRKRRKAAIQRAALIAKQLKADEEAERAERAQRAAGSKTQSSLGRKTHSTHPPSHPTSASSSRRSSQSAGSQPHSLSFHPTLPTVTSKSDEMTPCEELPEEAAQSPEKAAQSPEKAAESPFKAMKHYQTRSTTYYQNQRKTNCPTVRNMLVSMTDDKVVVMNEYSYFPVNRTIERNIHPMYNDINKQLHMGVDGSSYLPITSTNTITICVLKKTLTTLKYIFKT